MVRQNGFGMANPLNMHNKQLTAKGLAVRAAGFADGAERAIKVPLRHLR
jgi:hypothetical protein